MKRLNTGPAALTALLTLAGCPQTTVHRAEVELTIDGVRHDYTTTRAQWDRQEEGGRYSIYLLPEDPSSDAPYVCMRTYVGNPVAQLWVRHAKQGVEVDEEEGLPKYQCFVPGTLRTGQHTLGWTTREDGSERPRNETGDSDCTATLSREGQEVHLRFDAKLPLFVRKTKGQSEADAKADTIQAVGSAVLELGNGGK